MLYRCCYDDGLLPRNGQSCRSSRPRVVPLEKAGGNTISFAAGHAKGTVSTLSAERTFWEKATILHALHHGSKMRPEMSRHFYDIVMMAASGVDDAALAHPDLLTQVVAHKSMLFADPRASYETAALGSLRLDQQSSLAGSCVTITEPWVRCSCHSRRPLNNLCLASPAWRLSSTAKHFQRWQRATSADKGRATECGGTPHGPCVKMWIGDWGGIPSCTPVPHSATMRLDCRCTCRAGANYTKVAPTPATGAVQ